MKACTLTPGGRVLQRERFKLVRGGIVDVERLPTALTVRFDPGTDETVLAKLVATERMCCTFLDIDYADRVLRIGSDDPRDLDPFEAMLR